MKRQKRRRLCAAFGMLGAFALWTAAVSRIDVQAIGPEGSAVGFAALNGFVHGLTGVHLSLYAVTDWLGLVPLGFVLGFAILGLDQWVRRKKFRAVDRSILVLGGFYLTVMAAYVLFERFPVNYRPVLLEGVLEASYPSSTTLLVLTVLPTAMMQLHGRIRHPRIRGIVLWSLAAFLAFMVVCRLISGVHWVSDIVGGVLLGGGLVMLYVFFAE